MPTKIVMARLHDDQVDLLDAACNARRHLTQCVDETVFHIFEEAILEILFYEDIIDTITTQRVSKNMGLLHTTIKKNVGIEDLMTATSRATKSISHLIAQRALSDAQVLLRSALESTITIADIAHDPSKRKEKLVYYREILPKMQDYKISTKIFEHLQRLPKDWRQQDYFAEKFSKNYTEKIDKEIKNLRNQNGISRSTDKEFHMEKAINRLVRDNPKITGWGIDWYKAQILYATLCLVSHNNDLHIEHNNSRRTR